MFTPKDTEKQRDRKLLLAAGYASQVDGEPSSVFTSKVVEADVDAYGGLGMNGNFGSGRAAIVTINGKSFQIKGSGRTMMVNARSDQYHRSGASVIREGIWEAAWSQLLAKEMPYGAYQTLAVLATGSQATLHGHNFDPRVTIIREDPVRPAHFLLNPDGMVVQPEEEKARVTEAMKHIVDALPKPAGYKSQGRQADFVVGINEMIDRQAIQHGYAWAHSLFHGGTSPSNTGLDGRMLDFGSYSAFDGYPRARVMDEDGFMGDTEIYKRDFIRDSYASLEQTLPMDLKSVLPPVADLEKRFDENFERTRAKEMLRLAGSMDEFVDSLYETPEGKKLASVLLKMAEAGNSKGIEVWQGQSPFGTGTYNLGAVLKRLTELPLVLQGNRKAIGLADARLTKLVPNVLVRQGLVEAYGRFFEEHGALASENGISSAAEVRYRAIAVDMRNAKMTSMFRTHENEEKISRAIDAFEKGDASAIGRQINDMISKARREHRDAGRFAVVMRDGTKFDAKKEVLEAVTRPSAERVRTERASLDARTCRDLFR